MTFRAFDVDKFMAYIPHSEIVNGTRIVEQLRDRETQLSTFMHYGNFAVGKLLAAKYIGSRNFPGCWNYLQVMSQYGLESVTSAP